MGVLQSAVGYGTGAVSKQSTQFVQGALNQFPSSLGGPDAKLVTDGACGPKTIAAIRGLQNAIGMRHPDGRVDLYRRTHHALAKGPECLRVKYRVGLHLRNLTATQVPFEKIFRSTQKVYEQCGISIELKSARSLHLSPADSSKFRQIDGQCTWQPSSVEYTELLGSASDVSSSEIVVFYVDRFSEARLLGCGGHLPNRPACIVAAAGTQWTTAHEVGHVLLSSNYLPVHHADEGNLMFAFSINRSTAPWLNIDQVDQMRKSPCCLMGAR